MLQPVFVGLVRGSEDYRMTSDDLYQMWSVSTKAKSAMVHGRRLENLSWRLWYTSTIRGRMQQELAAAQATTSADESSQNESSSFESIMPRGRALFASACTSILAEIQDASIRQSARPAFMSIPFQSAHHSGTGNSSDYPASPPQRARSPGTGESSIRKKKNVDKFLKKFRSNLEGISELFDEEKVGDLVASESVLEEMDGDATVDSEDNTSQQHVHFGQSPDYIIHDSASETTPKTAPRVKSQKSILTKLIQRAGSHPASPLSTVMEKQASNGPSAHAAIPEPTKQANVSFLSHNNSSDSFISNQLEMLALGRYDRNALSPTLQRTKSATPVNQSTPPMRPSKVNAAALAASKFVNESELEDYDSQMIIWWGQQCN